jgi:uncharacterized protein (TIGR02246 family)
MARTDYHAEIKRIRQIREAVEKAEREMDAEAFGHLFAKNVAMMPRGGPTVRGSEDVIAFHRDLYDGYERFDVDFSIEDITVLGGLAMEKGSYTAELVPKSGGEPENVTGRYLYFYEQDADGAWKILRMSW